MGRTLSSISGCSLFLGGEMARYVIHRASGLAGWSGSWKEHDRKIGDKFQEEMCE